MSAGRIIGALFVAGLIALGVWVARNTYWDEIEIPAPLRNEAATNPFYAAERFTQELGIESEWERVLTSFPTDEVIVLSTWHWTLVEARQRRLQGWVERGGRLVTDGAVMGIEDDFKVWSGISRQRGRQPDTDKDKGDDSRVPPASNAIRECRVLHRIGTSG